MLKELAIIGAVITPYINQPSRANITPAYSYEVINATDHSLQLLQGYSDEYVSVNAKTIMQYPYGVDKEDGFGVFISKTDYPTKPTNFYYIYDAADFEDPITITFTEQAGNVWYAYIEEYEPATGLQIGQYDSVLGETYYFANDELSAIMVSTAYGESYTMNLLEGYTAKLQMEDGTWTQTLNNITLVITALPNDQFYNYLQVIVPQLNNAWIAMNATPADLDKGTTQPYLVFYGGYTNKLVFQSGVKRVRYGNLDGLDPFCFTKNNTGYKGEQGSYTSNDGWSALDAGIRLVTKSFETAAKMFDWVIYPGITIGLFVLVPLMFSLVLWLIKLVKKGS